MQFTPFKTLRGLFISILLTFNLISLGCCLIVCVTLNQLLCCRFNYQLQTCIDTIYQTWVSFNRFILIRLTQTELHCIHDLKPKHFKQWTLLTCNHQSWADILILQHCFEGHLPHLKFLMKHTLIWVPMAGIIAKILGYPMIQRHRLHQRKRHSKYRYANTHTLAQACKALSTTPTTLVCFPEGSRITPERHQAQQSPYQHLLRPQYRGVLNILSGWSTLKPNWCHVAICYQNDAPSLWALMCGNIPSIKVQASLTTFNPMYLKAHDLKEHLHALWTQTDLRV